MDAMLAKALLERIAMLEEKVKKLESPWTHDFSNMKRSGTITAGWDTTWTTTST